MKVMGERNLKQFCYCFDCGENVALFTGPWNVLTNTAWYDAALGLSQIRKVIVLNKQKTRSSRWLSYWAHFPSSLFIINRVKPQVIRRR